MVDSILNMGMPSPIDLQVSSTDLEQADEVARDLADRIRAMPGVGEAYIPQDMNYPAVRLDVDRVHASELGLDPENIVHNVITALNSNTHDRAQLLGGSQNRKRLLPDRPILRTTAGRRSTISSI